MCANSIVIICRPSSSPWLRRESRYDQEGGMVDEYQAQSWWQIVRGWAQLSYLFFKVKEDNWKRYHETVYNFWLRCVLVTIAGLVKVTLQCLFTRCACIPQIAIFTFFLSAPLSFLLTDFDFILRISLQDTHINRWAWCIWHSCPKRKTEF